MSSAHGLPIFAVQSATNMRMQSQSCDVAPEEVKDLALKE
jgi:hypothetical protein